MDAVDVVLMHEEQPERAERFCACDEPRHRFRCRALIPDDGIAFCDDCLEGDHSEDGRNA